MELLKFNRGRTELLHRGVPQIDVVDGKVIVILHSNQISGRTSYTAVLAPDEVEKMLNAFTTPLEVTTENGETDKGKEIPEKKEPVQIPKKRGRKPKAQAKRGRPSKVEQRLREIAKQRENEKSTGTNG